MRYGICAGRVIPELAHLNIDWAFGTAENSLADEFQHLPRGIEYVPLTFEQEPRAEWRRFVTWDCYNHYWLIGNEPHTDWDNQRPIADVAQVFVRQMEFIKTFDRDAKFIVTCSTQGQLPYNRHSPQNFIGDLWTHLPREIKNQVAGFHVHIYPRWISDDPAVRWNPQLFIRYLRKLRFWMDAQELLDREFWVSEFGFEGYFADAPADYVRCMDYTRALLAHARLQEWVTRFAFYASHAMPSTNWYCGALDEKNNLTGLGAMWRLAR